MGYSRRILNYPKKIVLSDLTYMMSMVDPMVISVETSMRYRGYSLEKEFTESIFMNP